MAEHLSPANLKCIPQNRVKSQRHWLAVLHPNRNREKEEQSSSSYLTLVSSHTTQHCLLSLLALMSLEISISS